MGAAAVVRTVAPDMRRRGRGTLLFTTGGAAVDPHRDRAVSAIAYAAESAYVRMLHDALADDGVHAAQVTVVGPIGQRSRHETGPRALPPGLECRSKPRRFRVEP